MKKFLSFFLVLTMVLSLLSGITIFAETEELLKNPGIEEGDKGYIAYGAAAYEVGKKYAHSDNKGILIKERTSQYGTVAQDIRNILTLNGPGRYRASIWVRLEEESDVDIKGMLVLNIQSNEAENASYLGSGQKTLTTQWQKFSWEGEIKFDAKKGFKTGLIYQQSYGAGGVAPNVFVDDFSLVKLDEVNGIPLDQVEGDVAPENSTGAQKGKEILLNPGFEEGDETDWDANGRGDAEISENYAHSGSYGLVIKGRSNDMSHSQNLEDALTLYGPGKYTASVWVKLPDDFDTGNKEYEGQLRVIFRKKDGSGTRYHSSAWKVIKNEWQQFALNADMEFEAGAGFEEAKIFFYTKGRPDIVVDDFSLKKTSAVSGVDPNSVQKEEYPDYKMEHINTVTSPREDEFTFGAIRWDCWYNTGVSAGNVMQVEKTLSPSEYHFRAPFFANIEEDGSVKMPRPAQEIFDQEMLYAKEAGINYFAYLWYDGEMSAARKLHPTSKYKDDVKMVMMLSSTSFNKTVARNEIIEHFQQSYYFTVFDGRPLMYYYLNSGNKNSELQAAQKEIKYYRAKCEELGIPAPYAVIMNVSGQEATKVYGDAFSRYSVGGTSDKTFNEFITGVQNNWLGYNKAQVQYVPNLTFGWHAQPRYKNPVQWMKVEENSWVPYPTDEEMYNHISYALSYMDHPNVQLKTKLNTVIFYAWNEHDEGSWICPTLAVDKDGNQLYNEDGSKKINDSRVKILKQAIDDFKAGKRTEIIIDGISNVSNQTVKPTADHSNDGNLNNNNNTSLGLYIGIAAGVIVVGGGAVLTIIIIKKKNKKEETPNEQG